MTRDVEERIVAMYFDNEDFEKKAKTTVETLGQLQKGLNLEDAAKGFSVFDKLSKAMNLDKAQKTLTKIKTTVGGMGSIFKKVFNLGPIDEAAAAVENFKNRYLNRVLGFDLAHTVANALEGAFRELTIQPISAGWTQYENKMDSVKTIMSSTGESIETVQTHLEDLTTYANKTIYSLSDMTSNLGKFTNNGMKLEDSVQAMKGIANAAADAGQGAQQASMAMYNFSQAMGVGKMTTIDWKSIENANMATQRLKNTFIEMAAAQGELHKEFSETDKKYHYYITKNSKGQVEKDKKKWTEVTAKNFRETLSKDWLTSASMMHALQVYSGDVIDPDTIKSWGITDPESIKQLEKIGKDALEAATQVRTFTKMMDALKEAAQSGWADTFELIFGNMEEGTNLWTRLNDTLDPILSKSAETRNNMLKIWAGSKESTKEEESELAEKTESLKNLQDYLKKIEEENDLEGNLSKIDSMKNKIVEYKKQIADLKAEQAKDGKSATNVEQIERRQKAIKDYEKAIRELEKKNRDLKAKEDARTKNKAKSDELKTKIEQYKSEIKALQAADGLDSEYDPDKSKKRQKQIDAKQKEIDKLQQQLNRINKTTGEDEIEKTKKEIKELQKEIDKLTGKIDEKNNKQKSEFVDEQGRSGRDIAIDSMFKLIELAQKFGETFSNAFHNVFGTMDAEKLFNTTKSIGDAIEGVFKWFTEGSDEAPSRLSKIQKGLQGVFSVIKTVVNFIKIGFNLLKRLVSPVADVLINAFEKFGEFFDGLGDLSPVEVFEKLGEGLQKTWEKVKKFFTPQDILDKNGKTTGQTEIPVITWLKNVWSKFKKTVQGWAEENGLGEVWTKVTDWWNTAKSTFERGKAKLDKVWNDVKDWFASSGISGFLSNTWSWIVSQFSSSGNIVSGYRNGRLESWYEEAPVVSWLSGIWEGIKSTWNSIKDWKGWQTIAQFASDTWGWISSQFTSSGNIVSGYRNGRLESWYEEAPVVSWLSGIWNAVEKAWNSIKDWEGWQTIAQFASDTWGWISSQFSSSGNIVSGYRNGRLESWYEEAPVVSWLSGIWEGIKGVWNSIKDWEGWQTIAQFASDTWGWISSQFSSSGNIVSGYRNGKLESWYEEAPVTSWLKGIWEGIKGVWDEIVGWSGWSALGEFLSNTWTWITGLFAGSESSVAGASEAAVEASKQATTTPEQTEEALGFFERIIGAISDFITKIAGSVSGAIIPEGVSKFLTGTAEFLNGFLGAIGDLLGKIGRVLSGKGDSSDVFAFVVTIITAISGIVGKLLLAKWTSGMSDFTSFGTSFLAFSGGIMLIASAISLLTAIDQSKLGSALGVVEVVALTIGGILAALKAIGSGGAQQALAQTPAERFFTNLINKLASIGLITIILKEIPPIIEAVKNAKSDGAENIGDELLKIAEAIAVLFGAVTIITIAMGKLGGPTGIDPKAMSASLLSLLKVFIVISAVALAVGGLGEAFDGIFGDNSHEAILGALDKAAEFMQGLGNVIGGFFMGLFGIKSDVAKTQDALQIADMLAEASSAFDAEKISGLSRMMTLIAKLSDNTVKIDTGKMSDFGVAMGNIGDGIYTIATYISEVEGPLSEMHNPDSLQYKKLEGVLGFVERFGDTLSSFAPLIEAGGLNSKFRDFDALVTEIKKLAEDENLNSLTESLSKMMTKFSTDLPNGDTIQFDGIAIVGKLYDAIQIGLDAKGDLPQFDATSIVDAITLALSEGDLAIATVVHGMVQKGLGMSSGLVGDESGYTLPEYLIPKETTEINNGDSVVNSFFGNLGLGDMESSITKYQEKLDGLSLSFGNFETNLPDIGTAMKENGWTSLFSFEDEKGNTTSMFDELQTQLGLVGDQLNEMGGLEVTITPVFTMENLTRDKLQSALDAELGGIPLSANATISNPVVTIDFREMSAELGIEDIRAKLQSLIMAVAIADSNNQNAISRLSSDIDSVAGAVASMQMYLDGDVLVGQITPRVDAALGRRSQVYDRTGVTFNIPKMTIK